MNLLARRSLLGAISGAMASIFLVPTLGRPWWGIILGVAAGAGYPPVPIPPGTPT
ncbi:MAG TPA: hypothetical protein VMU26_09890 [Candidatus Polarisedimenticolia bacterium]|nr:hypothetical protein [Candidatus Polarisedimenticolia bacterium]